MDWEQVDQSPRPTLQEPILTSKPCLPSSGDRESFQLLILATLAPPQGTGHWGVGVADTGQDARTLSLQLQQSQKVRQGPHLSLSIDAVPHQLPRNLDHCLLQGPYKEAKGRNWV